MAIGRVLAFPLRLVFSFINTSRSMLAWILWGRGRRSSMADFD